MMMRTLLTGLLALPCLAHAAEPLVLQGRPSAGGWMDLLGGSTFEKVEQLAQARSDALDTRFTRFGSSPATDGESAHGVLVAYNDTGWLLVLRHDHARPDPTPRGKYEIFLLTDPAAGLSQRVPHRLILDLDDRGFTNRMAPNHMGAALGIEERSRQIGPRLKQERLLSTGRDYQPLKVDYKTFPRPEGGQYATFFFAWGNFPGCLPATERKGSEWRLKIVRTTSDGTQYVWGAHPHPYAGYGLLHWPLFTPDLLMHIHRQWLTAGYGEAYAERQNALQSLWTVSRREYDYGFLAVPEATFEPRNKTSDELYYRSALAPLIARNQKLAEATARTKTPNKPIAFMSFPPEVQKLIFAELPRLELFAYDADDLRRDYLLNRLLGRTLPLPPEVADTSTDLKDMTWEAVDATAERIDIKLDDVKF